MKIKEHFIFFAVFLVVVGIFFYKSIIYGYVPFPGDLLIAEYNSWKTYSYLGYAAGSYPNKAQYFDVLRQLYPWKTLTLSQFKARDLSLWNPYNFSGAPLLANFQSAVFYPLNFLYFVLSQIQAWSILVMLQPLLASFFTYLFARKIGISKIGAIFSAVSYGFSSFMTVWLEYNTIGHVILWLPLSLLATEMLLKKINVFSMMVFIIAIFTALLAGHPQVFTYSLLFVSAYLIYRIFTLKKLNIDRIRKSLLFFLLTILAIGIGSVQILPGIELIKESARAPHDYSFLINKILIQPWQFIMMIVPDFFGNPATRNYWLDDTYIGKVTYIGIIPLFFVLFSFRHLRNSMIRFFAAAVSIVLIMVSFNPVTIFLYRFELPFISTSAPTLSVFLFCFCASLLSGFGVDIWRKEKQVLGQIVRFVFPAIFVIVFLWIVVSFAPNLISDRLPDHIGAVYRNLFLATLLVGIGIFLIIIGTLKKKLIYTVLIILFIFQTGDLFRFFTKFNPFVPRELVFPNAPVLDFLKKESGIDRFWGYRSANIEANFATQHSLFSPDGYDPLYPKRYGEFIQASQNGKTESRFTRLTRSDAVIASGGDLLENSYRLKIIDLLGVKYVFDRVENGSTDKTFQKDRFKLIYEKDGWKIFENLKALPRGFLASDYKVFSTNEEFEKIFFDKNFDPSKTILLEENINKDLALRFGGSNHLTNVQILVYTPNEIKLETSTEGDSLLFLSDTYFPGWKAFVDGKETKIYRANYTFRAVGVPSGNHDVEFLYNPLSFKIGYIISLISVGVFIMFLTIKKKIFNI